MQETLNQILAVIRPENPGEIAIYAILLLSLLASMTMPDKNDRPVYLLYIVIIFSLLDFGRNASEFQLPLTGFDDEGFGTYMIHIGMAVLPFIAAGMVRRTGRKGALAVPLCLIVGVIASIYAIASFAIPASVYG